MPPAAPMNDNLAEPFYIDPVRRSELYESIHGAQMYEVPSTTTSFKKQSEAESEHAYHVLEDMRGSQPKRSTEEDNEDSDEYHTLEPPPSVLGQEREGEGGHLYQMLEPPNSLNNEPHYEFSSELSNSPVEVWSAYSIRYMEPLNNRHIGNNHFVHHREVALLQRQ